MDMAADFRNSGEWMETSEECLAASLFLGKLESRCLLKAWVQMGT